MQDAGSIRVNFIFRRTRVLRPSGDRPQSLMHSHLVASSTWHIHAHTCTHAHTHSHTRTHPFERMSFRERSFVVLLLLLLLLGTCCCWYYYYYCCCCCCYCKTHNFPIFPHFAHTHTHGRAMAIVAHLILAQFLHTILLGRSVLCENAELCHIFPPLWEQRAVKKRRTAAQRCQQYHALLAPKKKHQTSNQRARRALGVPFPSAATLRMTGRTKRYPILTTAD